MLSIVYNEAMRYVLLVACFFLVACQPKSEAEEEVNLDRLVQSEENVEPVR